MAYLKRSDVNSGDAVFLHNIVSESPPKKSGIIELPIPLTDSEDTNAFDFSGVKRTIVLQGIVSGVPAVRRAFIDNIEAFINGQQNVGASGLTEFVSDQRGLQVDITNKSGTFTVGETITGTSSSATATVDTVNTNDIIVTYVTEDFTNGENITGGTSGATADVDGATGDGTSTTGNKLNVKIKDFSPESNISHPLLLRYTLTLIQSSTTI